MNIDRIDCISRSSFFVMDNMVIETITRECVFCLFVLERVLKIEGVVLHRVEFLSIFVLHSQDFKRLAAPSHLQMGQVPPPRRWGGTVTMISRTETVPYLDHQLSIVPL